jgi:hypothetical protein
MESGSNLIRFHVDFPAAELPEAAGFQVAMLKCSARIGGQHDNMTRPVAV